MAFDTKEKAAQYAREYYAKHKAHLLAYRKTWRQNNPEAAKRHAKKVWDTHKRKYESKRKQKLYGMSQEQVDAMGDIQKGLCAICSVRPWKHVDHDHQTGQVRKLLCVACNIALGGFQDSPELLRRAAAYVEEHRA